MLNFFFRKLSFHEELPTSNFEMAKVSSIKVHFNVRHPRPARSSKQPSIRSIQSIPFPITFSLYKARLTPFLYVQPKFLKSSSREKEIWKQRLRILEIMGIRKALSLKKVSRELFSWRFCAFPLKRLYLQTTIMDTLVFKILSVVEAVVLVSTLCFFFLCCGCHF